MKAECVLRSRALIGESPFWDTASETLLWVDIPRREIHRFDPGRGTDDRWSLPEEPGCIVTAVDGGLAVALRKGFYRFAPDTGALERIASIDPEPPSNRLNDGRTDRQGRFWCGSVDEAERDPTGALYCLDHRGDCTRWVDDIICSNALCWSPDGRTMYFGDSARSVVWAWDFDPASGAITDRRVFVEIPAADGVPDGAAVDSEGHVWIAQWGGWCIVRYDPVGRSVGRLDLPVSQPTCPAFGGPNLATLYVTSAAIGLDQAALAREPEAGGIFAAEVGVHGVVDVPYRFDGQLNKS